MSHRHAWILLLVGGTAGAYELTGYDWAWESDPIEEPFLLNTDDFPSTMSRSEMVAAYEAATVAWYDEGMADVRLDYGGTTTDTSWEADYVNVGQYHPSTTYSYTVGLSQFWTSGTRIVDCDIRFYGENAEGSISWSADSGGSSAYEADFQYVATHELGHCLGLNHSGDSNAIMYFTSSGATAPADRELDDDDIAGLQAIYGAATAELSIVDTATDEDSSGDSSGDDDGIVEWGEVFELDVSVANDGRVAAEDVVIAASSDSSSLVFVEGSVLLGDISAGREASLTASTGFIVVLVVGTCTRDETAEIELVLEDADGNTWDDVVEVELVCSDDRDGDGYEGSVDCDDDDPDVHPGAPDACDGVDDNCSGDESDATGGTATAYTDSDGDGYGDPDSEQIVCVPSAGQVSQAGDCDDGNRDVNPLATEYCDGVDNDCDGDVDGDAISMPTWFPDADGDGYGEFADWIEDCDQPNGYVDNSDDCDDSDATIYPGNGHYTEYCVPIEEETSAPSDDCACSSGGRGAALWPGLVLPLAVRRRRC